MIIIKPITIKPSVLPIIGKTNKTKIVALTVNPTNVLLDEIFKHIKPEFIQLHGNENNDYIKKLNQKPS